MTRYLISFDDGAMTFPAEDLPDVAAAARAVVEEAEEEGVWVFGGGLHSKDEVSVVETDGTVTDGAEAKAYIGGFSVVDVPSREEALARMADLKGSQTHENLKAAFAGESQANRRYLYFAQKADVEGYPDVAALFRSVAEGETGHAFGHFDFLASAGDPVTDEPVGPTADNLKSAIAGETYEYTEMYPGFAKTARD